MKRDSAQFFFSIGQVEKGIEPPSDLVSACNLLGEVKNFQDECVQVFYLYYILTSVVWAFFETGWSQLNEFVLNSKRKWDTSQTHISPPPTLTFSKSDKIRGTCCAMRSLFIGLIINCILTESQSFGRCQRICWKDDQPSICSKEHCCLQDKVRSMLSLASYVSFTLSNYKVDLSSYSFLPLGSSDDQPGTELEWQWTTFDIESENHGKIRIWNLIKFRLT